MRMRQGTTATRDRAQYDFNVLSPYIIGTNQATIARLVMISGRVGLNTCFFDQIF
jgi:hypothetical protein